jgi:hypothetical protein
MLRSTHRQVDAQPRWSSEPPAVDRPQRPALPEYPSRFGAHRTKPSHPTLVGRAHRLSGESQKSCSPPELAPPCPRDVTGRSGSSRAMPSTQSMGRGCGAASCSGPRFSRQLPQPVTARPKSGPHRLYAEYFLARLNTLASVMWSSYGPSPPRLTTARARRRSAALRNFLTSDPARIFIRRIWLSNRQGKRSYLPAR